MRNKSAIIAAVDLMGGFGKGGKMPWHIPEDFKHFKATTAGAACVMGRVTYEELCTLSKKDELLPGRECFVVTSTLEDTPRATKISNIREVFDLTDRPVFFLGGKQVFEDALDIVDEVHLTIVKGSYECDVFFPVLKMSESFVMGVPQNISEKINIVKWTRGRIDEV